MKETPDYWANCKDYIVHTNGPWSIEGDRVKTAISSGHKHVAMVNYFNCGAGDPRTISDEEHEANAKLIAAAPDMLEVLLWLDDKTNFREDEFGGCLFLKSDFDKIKKVINKALVFDQESRAEASTACPKCDIVGGVINTSNGPRRL